MNSTEHTNIPIDLSIRKAWLKTLKMYNQKASAYGVSISLGFVLLSIDKEGTPSTQLGPRMGMEPTSLSRTLKSMEDQGLIYRKQSETDKRVVHVFLTDLGLEKRRIARDEVLAHNNKIYQNINPQELEVFLKVLEQINGLTED
jgi:DNA-binding MarR family transcriptional regulator